MISSFTLVLKTVNGKRRIFKIERADQSKYEKSEDKEDTFEIIGISLNEL